MEMTLQEILKLAAVDTVLGMGTVFTVLIIISLFIWAIGVAFKQEDPKKAAVPAAAAAAAAAPKAEAADDADAEIVAAISAAISQFIKNQYGEEIGEGQYIVRNVRRASWKHIS